MGTIWLAHDPVIGRKVAIKLVRTDLLDGGDREAYLERFRQEARAAGRCAHPNIVAIYDFALHEGDPFLAMEYIDGPGLGDVLREAGRFTAAHAVALIGQVLDALGAAHASGLVHRDVKPANILVMRDGQVKVTDFGISRLNTSEMTMDGAVIGTPAYMSPEQCRGEPLDARSDLFSTGTVLHELLTGARPFPGRNTAEITYQLLRLEPPDLAQAAPDVPAPVARVLRRAMEKQPEARFATAPEMAEALRRAMREAGHGEEHSTVVLPRSLSSPLSVPLQPAVLDDATLSTIERMLALHIGPIARRLVRDAARTNPTLETVCETVARSIEQPAERARFLAGVRGGTGSGVGGMAIRSGVASPGIVMASGGGTGVSQPLSAERIAHAERALMAHMGPIAKLLVKRAVPGATSEAALWEKLAAQIEDAAGRTAFLRQRPGG